MVKKTVRDIDVAGRRVLVRVDFNVPQDESGAITDDRRIEEALPTIRYLIEQGAKVILCSHLGRPKGKVNPKYTLQPVAVRLAELLNQPVELAGDCIGPAVEQAAASLKAGEVLLLENLRFHAEEEANDPAFAQALASLAEIYVNDAFGTAHRAHASTAGVAADLPAVAGFLMQKEIEIMGKALSNPERPFVAILGGAKVADKLGVIENLLTKVDTLIIGGGMAYTFLKAQGHEIGTSLLDADKLEMARQLMEQARVAGKQFLLPVDVVVTDKLEAGGEVRTVAADAMPADRSGVDIGPQSRALFAEAIKGAGTVVWNGPVGLFEVAPFDEGTKAVAQAIAESGAISIVGGGDSAAAMEKLGFADRITHISTGGGASLEFLEGKELPGVAVLLDK
jgi:phosphoglycerate kinase